MSQWSGCQTRCRWFLYVLWLQWDKNIIIWRIYIKFHYNMFNISILGTEIKFKVQRMPFHNSYYAKYIFLSNLSIYWIIYCYCIPHSLKFTMQQWTMKHQETRHKLICIYSISLRSPIFFLLLYRIISCF